MFNQWYLEIWEKIPEQVLHLHAILLPEKMYSMVNIF